MKEFIALERRLILIVLTNRRLLWYFWQKSIRSIDYRWKSIA